MNDEEFGRAWCEQVGWRLLSYEEMGKTVYHTGLFVNDGKTDQGKQCRLLQLGITLVMEAHSANTTEAEAYRILGKAVREIQRLIPLLWIHTGQHG